jgi:hypothetical protein
MRPFCNQNSEQNALEIQDICFGIQGLLCVFSIIAATNCQSTGPGEVPKLRTNGGRMLALLWADKKAQISAQ